MLSAENSPDESPQPSNDYELPDNLELQGHEPGLLDKVYATGRELVAPALGAAAIIAFAKVGFAIDRAINPDLVGAISENFAWWRTFTSEHAVSAIDQLYPVASALFWGSVGALWGKMQLEPWLQRYSGA